MTAWQLDNIGIDISSFPPRPGGVDDPVLTTDHGRATDRRVFSQRARQRPRVCRLRPKMIDGRSDRGLVTVGVEHRTDEVEIDPYCAELLVRLAPCVQISVQEVNTNHVWL